MMWEFGNFTENYMRKAVIRAISGLVAQSFRTPFPQEAARG
jgi:hypothetical protein